MTPPTSPTDRSNRYIIGPNGPRSIPAEPSATNTANTTNSTNTANTANTTNSTNSTNTTNAASTGGAWNVRSATSVSPPSRPSRTPGWPGSAVMAHTSEVDDGEGRWVSAGMVRGPVPPEELARLGGIAQATIADPIPLGLAGFAAATFTISVAYCGWFGVPAAVIAIPVALIYGGIGQFLAGMWAFRRGNVLAATAFSTFGCFNMSWALLNWLALAHVLPTLGIATGPAYVEGVFVLMFAIIAAYLGVAALGESRMIAAILFVLAFTYLCDGCGVWIGGANWLLAIGGYAGIVVSLMAFYESAAVVINSSFHREVLPTFPAQAEGRMRNIAARLGTSLRASSSGLPRPNTPTPA